MAIPGWQPSESPFHAGERAIQARLGAAERMDTLGRRMIRDVLPQQHRQFYGQLSYLLVGTVDAQNRPWASILVGEPGFVGSGDERSLRVAAQPLAGDPLGENLAVGADIGFLGIELHTRRRNRINGVVTALDAEGIHVQVGQTFGNCPKYIQARRFDLQAFDPAAPRPIQAFTTLDVAARSMIAAADTFFIATAYLDTAAGAARGVDISHRGGHAGFVRINGDTLTVPDFAGNGHFNTLGNVEVNPQAGLLFMDFATGDLLYLTGRAEVIWEGAEIATYAGAERLFKFHLSQGYRVEASLPLSWSEREYSPFLAHTGPW